MRKRRMIRALAALLLCLLLLQPSLAFAEEGQEEPGLIDPDALQAILDEFLAAHPALTPNDFRDISVGFCYTATGETWISNPDHWYYSASLYKVPLMMLLAEREHNGEISQETDMGGISFATAEEYVLVYSNNEWGHRMMAEAGDGSESECRRRYRQFSDLPEDYYIDDFYDYSFFTCQFMMDVMKTLYFEQERFPHVLDCLKRAQNDHYFHAAWGWKYPVAQKYGSYVSPYNNYEYNHTAGVIYTENPFILVVMTQNMSIGETYLTELSRRYGEYSLSLDEMLPDYLAAQEAAKAPDAPESSEELVTEWETLAQDNRTEQTPASNTTEDVLPAQQNATPEQRELRPAVLVGCGVALALLVVVYVCSRSRRKVAAGRH